MYESNIYYAVSLDIHYSSKCGRKVQLCWSDNTCWQLQSTK